MGRGPSYPYVNLEEAVGLADKVYQFTRKSAAPLASVIKEAWQYSPTSSSGEKVLAALKSFGLVEESASGDAKMLKISDSAYRILVDDEGSPERKAALRDAALSPKWYKFCWEKWGSEMPPSMRSNLLFEHGFVESTVDKFIQDYKDSIKYGGVLGTPKKVEDAKDSKPKDLPSIKIGDAVQWESQGVLQFLEPRKVREISEDGEWAFVEGSNTGILLKELTVVADKQTPTPASAASQPPRPRTTVIEAQPDAGARQDLFSLPEGTVTVSWPASISQESFQDIADWLTILERKIKRSVKAGQAQEE
jgi:hypothetical protein